MHWMLWPLFILHIIISCWVSGLWSYLPGKHGDFVRAQERMLDALPVTAMGFLGTRTNDLSVQIVYSNHQAMANHCIRLATLIHGSVLNSLKVYMNWNTDLIIKTYSPSARRSIFPLMKRLSKIKPGEQHTVKTSHIVIISRPNSTHSLVKALVPVVFIFRAN